MRIDPLDLRQHAFELDDFFDVVLRCCGVMGVDSADGRHNGNARRKHACREQLPHCDLRWIRHHFFILAGIGKMTYGLTTQLVIITFRIVWAPALYVMRVGQGNRYPSKSLYCE